MVSIGAAVCKLRYASHARMARPDHFYGVMKGVSMEWKDQYKHPKWQKKRLEALENAAFVCQTCGRADVQLHVHHKRYIKGRKVWEYQIDELDVLCEICHESAHSQKEALQMLIALLPSSAMKEVVDVLAGYCLAVEGDAGADTSLVRDYENDYSWDYRIGFLAGRLSVKLTTVESFQDLLIQIEALDDGGKICVTVPKIEKN